MTFKKQLQTGVRNPYKNTSKSITESDVNTTPGPKHLCLIYSKPSIHKYCKFPQANHKIIIIVNPL